MKSYKLVPLLAAAVHGYTLASCAGRTPQAAPPEDRQLVPAEKRHVLNSVVAILKEHYFDSTVAQATADALRARENQGDDKFATDGNTFANLLTRQLRDASGDMHFEVIYSDDPLPAARPEPSSADLARRRKALVDQNCMIEKAEVLDHNIGYLKLNWFADPAACEAKVKVAMASLNGVSAIIFDLRDCRGGDPGMVQLIAAYLFDYPEYWFSPRGAPTQDSWTRSPVDGNKLADKPAYVLTSHTTLSGAEQFCYDLKMLKRATVVGETTGGGAHAGVFHRIDGHFGIALAEVKAVNPYGMHDWEAVGVEPDVGVKSADALTTAESLAESRIERK